MGSVAGVGSLPLGARRHRLRGVWVDRAGVQLRRHHDEIQGGAPGAQLSCGKNSWKSLKRHLLSWGRQAAARGVRQLRFLYPPVFDQTGDCDLPKFKILWNIQVLDPGEILQGHLGMLHYPIEGQTGILLLKIQDSGPTGL